MRQLKERRKESHTQETLRYPNRAVLCKWWPIMEELKGGLHSGTITADQLAFAIIRLTAISRRWLAAFLMLVSLHFGHPQFFPWLGLHRLLLVAVASHAGTLSGSLLLASFVHSQSYSYRWLCGRFTRNPEQAIISSRFPWLPLSYAGTRCTCCCTQAEPTCACIEFCWMCSD
ncbi:hypothetical protein F4777DRAFT_257256 [Nemania sp. FL0916]|nr:hypothetical protein F4777DRAFT_257256 [Nemania sp. FL0916]